MARMIERKHYEIADGDAGIYETVDFMWHYAIRDSKEAEVKQLVSRLKGKTALATIKNIYDWVWQTVSYKLDPSDHEMITAPIHFVNGNRKTGDCDCMTTLLVCLLDAVGFDSAITVIAWRLAEYTHVFGEVWYNNDWFILDPTLKAAGFGKQDKPIKRYKRITKNDMAKLEVLSDGRARNHARLPSASALDNKFIPSRNRCVRPINDDNNRNTNNININFGTSVENSHNNSNGDAGGRFVDVNQLPPLNNIYTLPRPQQPIPLPQPIVLQPTTDGNYEVAIREPETEHIIAEPSVTPTQPPIAKKVLIDNKRPKYVPNVARNYYAEFP